MADIAFWYLSRYKGVAGAPDSRHLIEIEEDSRLSQERTIIRRSNARQDEDEFGHPICVQQFSSKLFFSD